MSGRRTPMARSRLVDAVTRSPRSGRGDEGFGDDDGAGCAHELAIDEKGLDELVSLGLRHAQLLRELTGAPQGLGLLELLDHLERLALPLAVGRPHRGAHFCTRGITRRRGRAA